MGEFAPAPNPGLGPAKDADPENEERFIEIGEVEMSSFDEYANKYKTARMERRNGVLQVTLHTDGQSLRWGFLPHGELPEAFHDIGTDRENRVVILTGTGAEFSGPRATPAPRRSRHARRSTGSIVFTGRAAIS